MKENKVDVSDQVSFEPYVSIHKGMLFTGDA